MVLLILSFWFGISYLSLLRMLFMMLYWEDSGCGIGFYYCFVVSLLILFIVFLKSKIIVVELEVLRKRLSDMLF